MSVTRRRSAWGIVALIGLVVLGACTNPSNAPTEYNDVTRANFMAGCTANYAGSGTTLAPPSTCECMYGVVTSELSINEFTSLNDALKSDKNAAIPDKVKQGWQACPGFGAAPGASSGGVAGPAPAGTPAPTGTSAPGSTVGSAGGAPTTPAP